MRVLVTGAASGFGAALAAIYAGRGDDVLVTDLPTMAPSLPAEQGGAVNYRKLDVREETDWSAARDWVDDQWGGLDLLINNAGVASGGRIDVLPVEDWEWIISINLLGVVKGCRTFVPMLKAQRSGRIVNVASMAGLVHPPNMGSYNVVKSGVVALSETLLHELAPYDVDVSAVCASFFRTNLHTSLRGSDPAMDGPAHRLITGARHDAATIAARTVKRIDRGAYLVLPHREGLLAYQAKRWVSPLYHRAMKRVGARMADKASQG
jgi:NAD(P)-dependent dehydrogenase (short-subunit alcohol dehydrogenase family)